MKEDKLKVVNLEENFYHDILSDKDDYHKNIKLNKILSHDEKLQLVKENDFDISSKFTEILADIYVHLLNLIIICILLGIIGATKVYGAEILVFMPIIAPFVIIIVFFASENETINNAQSEDEYNKQKHKNRLFKFSKHNKSRINNAVDQYEKYLLDEFNALYIDIDTKKIMHKYDFIKGVNYSGDNKNRVLDITLEIPDNYKYYYDIDNELDDIDKKALYEVGQKKKIKLDELLNLLRFVRELNKKESKIKLIDNSYANLKLQEENIYELNRRIDKYMEINNIDY